MDYKQTDLENFKVNFSFFNEKLPHEIVKRAYISIGSHLFIKLGQGFNSQFPNGKPRKKHPWTIWLGANVQWRLSRNGKFIVGSCQSYDKMNSEVQHLVGKKLLSSCIISQLMDIQFEFEDGYQLTSFLNVLIEEQWILFCSNGNTLGLNAETIDEVKEIQKLSDQFVIKNFFQDISLPIDQKKISSFSIKESAELYLNFEEKLSLHLNDCEWRLEKNSEYCIGSSDHTLGKNKNINQYLQRLIGKKLIKSSITHPFQDANFEFENGYVIKTFSCFKSQEQWGILKDNKETFFSANIPLANT